MPRVGVFSLMFGMLAFYASAQNITVHAVDGKSGQPLTATRLLVFVFNGASWNEQENTRSFDLQTDRNGVATIRPDQIEGADHLQIWVDFMTRCAQRNSIAISISDVFKTGVTDTNSCAKAISAQAAPGTLTIYARKPTLREEMAW